MNKDNNFCSNSWFINLEAMHSFCNNIDWYIQMYDLSKYNRLAKKLYHFDKHFKNGSNE